MGCWCARRPHRQRGGRGRATAAPSRVEGLVRHLEALEREVAGVRAELERLTSHPERD
ncbi:MAG TPA: hypothetical protein PLS29_00575 [Acidimicrobiales bacterium]|nr:hypothetical protein [Acidimicrobiales bacterium]